MSIESEYFRRLDEALIAYDAGDNTQLVRLYKTFGISRSNDEFIHQAATMKLITSRVLLPKELRRRAKKWLIRNGMDSWDDGDI